MSFSSDCKEDLVRVRVKPRPQRLSQLAGLVQTCGTLRLAREGTSLLCQSESLSVGKHILQLAEGLYTLESAIELTEREHRKTPLTVVTLSGASLERLLTDTGVLCRTESGELSFDKAIPEPLTATEECRRAFLRGTFLGAGSCSDPKRGYHLEIVTRTEAFASALAALLRDAGVPARTALRKERHVVYVKSEGVAGFLALIGASSATLAFEDVRTEREFRNYINRKNNCDTANIGKTVDAGVAQVQAIETLERITGLSHLPQPLYEAALLRLQHPDATLQQLADLAEIGKSGMNHRLTRLLRMAEELENG